MSTVAKEPYELASLHDFCRMVEKNKVSVLDLSLRGKESLQVRGILCSECGDVRNVAVSTIYSQCYVFKPSAPGVQETAKFLSLSEVSNTGVSAPGLLGNLFELRCLQCHSKMTVLIHHGADGPELLCFSSSYSGPRTPNSPPEVKYYLEQATRSQSVGANSAAVAMYRSALEQILHGHGYTKGTCGYRVGKLKEDIDDGKAPDPLKSLKPGFLRILKELGDGAVHPNDGDITKQKALDDNVLRALNKTFAALLDHIYEAPARAKVDEQLIEQAAGVFDTKKATP